MKLLALLISILALPISAHAANCPVGDPNVAECEQQSLHDIGAEPSPEVNPQDQVMVAYRPAHPAASPKLVVILHGHPGPATTAFSEFQAVAASLGYYSIALDADFNGNATASPTDTCAANKNPNVSCSDSPTAICGCYAGCYGSLDALIDGAFTDVGLPDPVVFNPPTGVFRYLDVKTRLKAYLAWLGGQNSGWNQFMSGGNIVWSKLVGAGLSRGSSLIGNLAKNNGMDRVLLFSGPVERTGGTSVADEPGAGTTPTMYSWGNAHNFSACTMSAGSPTWITDNHFGGNTGTAWATTNVYSFDSTNDANWIRVESNGNDGSKLNLSNLGMTKRHDTGQTDKFLDVGTATGVPSAFHGYHALTSSGVCTGSMSDGGHVETLSDSASACGNSDSEAFRHAVWTYMLTN
jgi:hypothetical protein